MQTRAAETTGRLIFLSAELSYFLFSLFVEAELLNCMNCNPVPRGSQEPSTQGALNSGLTSADSGFQLDLEIALSGVPAKVQPPTGFFSPAKDTLKRRMT
jgi:hypothetical protein